MFSKKHIVLTALITFVITAVVAVGGTFLYCTIASYDVVARARDMICEFYVDPLTEEQIDKMNDYAISAMVASLEDPYSYYLDAEMLEEYEESMEEEYVGIGVSVSYDKEAGKLTVISPTDGSPAQKAGVLPQDIIYKVDNIVVTEENYNDIVDHIRGNNARKGSEVTLYIKRGEKELVFKIARDVIPSDTVSHKMLDENVGYIRITEFKNCTVEEFSEALSFVTEQKAKGVVIDLRNNPGGYADSVIKMTDMLLPKCNIAYLEDSKGKREYFNSDSDCVDLPMVILANEGTASASELMAGSLQAHGKAKIVGKKTYGKAVGQTPLLLTHKTAIYLTNARYYTPKGECIDKKGIMPDVEVELPEELKKDLVSLEPSADVQLRMALEVLYDDIQK